MRGIGKGANSDGGMWILNRNVFNLVLDTRPMVVLKLVPVSTSRLASMRRNPFHMENVFDELVISGGNVGKVPKKRADSEEIRKSRV